MAIGHGLDLISATDGAGVQTYFLYDGLGSASGLTDGGGNTVAGYGYDVFGALRSGSPGATDFLFTGEQLDADSEMYYLRARYYDPAIGRFLSQDPLPGSNLYAYVGNNPVRFTDCLGLRASEGDSFRVECRVEAWLPDTFGAFKVNRIQLTQAFVYDGSRITRIYDPVVTGYAMPLYWHSSNLTYRWYWREPGRLARSEARVTWQLKDPVLGIAWRTIDVWIFIDFSGEGWCVSEVVE